MKNRILPLGLVAVLMGLSMVFLSAVNTAGQSAAPKQTGDGGSWREKIRANQNTGLVNPADIAAARRQAETLRLKSASAVAGLNWESMGPDNFPGKCWSAIFDNTDPSALTIVAGSASGGVWKSADLGLTWNIMPAGNGKVLKVSSLVQTSTGIIYAATGVTTCLADMSNEGDGIYRSSGGGQFTVIPATQTNPDFTGVSKLAKSAVSDRIFAATIGGLYYTDNGDDWNLVRTGFVKDVCVGSDATVIAVIGDSAFIAPGGNLNNFNNLNTGDPGLPTSGIGWMAFTISPDANVYYASLVNKTYKLLNVYRSGDKGATWTIIFPSNSTFEPFGSGYGCYSNTLIVFPENSNKLFLGGTNMWYGEKVLEDGFYNWEKVSFGDYGTLSPLFAPLYHHSYMFRPGYANQLVMATDGGVSVGTISATGITFQTENKNMRSAQFNSLAISAQKTFAMGGGDRIGSLALGYFYPSKVSNPSNGYQVWRVDETTYGDNYQPQPSNYCGSGGTCEWSNIDARVAVYTQVDNKTMRRQDFTDINYDNDFADGLKTDRSDHVPMRLWETFNQGEVFGITRDSSKFIADQQTIPPNTTIMVQSNSNRVMFPYFTTVEIPMGDTIMIPDPLATRYFVYADDTTGRGKGIFMTLDFLRMNVTTEYFIIYQNVTGTDPVTSIAVSADMTTLWAGTSKGRLIRITGLQFAYDSATANITSSQCKLTVKEFVNTPFPDRTVTSIAINPKDPNFVMATLGNYGNDHYVYYTKNALNDNPVFASIQGDLPKVPVFTGIIEMNDENYALIGTDIGVFSTSDLNAAFPSWLPEMQNIGEVTVVEIRQQILMDYRIVNKGIIYLATHGRGLWMETSHAVVGIDPVQGDIRSNSGLKLSPNPVQDKLTVGFYNETQSGLTLSVYDLAGRLVTVKALGLQPAGNGSATVSLEGLTQGTYIIRLGNSYGKIVKL